MGSVGRKFLIAGKGGLNLTHSDPPGLFATRYGARQPEIHRWLAAFDADALREWARGLGVETFVGSSGRVFPRDLKAAPLLRGWVRRLRASGVRFHVHHEWRGWDEEGALRFGDAVGEARVHAQAVVLALGGGSWPVLGSDGGWAPLLERRGIGVAPLMPSNCGFDVAWSAHFSARHAGQPVKPVVAEWRDAGGRARRRQGEFVVTANGVEGGLIYALEQKPSSKVFRLATIGSIIWAIGGLTLGALALAPPTQIGGGEGRAGRGSLPATLKFEPRMTTPPPAQARRIASSASSVIAPRRW